MSGHFREVCRSCQRVIAECRCPSKEKTIRFSTCDECRRREHLPVGTVGAPALVDCGGTPRRAQMQRWTPAERAIYEATRRIEAMPADVRLTDAQVLLAAAKDSVADHVDGVAVITRRSVAESQDGRFPISWGINGDPHEYSRTGKHQPERCFHCLRTMAEWLRDALGLDQPWPLASVLARLADAADHLLGDHCCDRQGYEGVAAARDRARQIVRALGEVR